ncbi:MAG TPA: hypothetical protein VGM37_21405 [Armatimonadota bacterium]|jgi:hypothetical protein
MANRLAAAVVAVISLASGSRAADHRVWLAIQNDWEGKRGFSLSLENSGSSEPLRLGSMRIVLGVADGKQWRYLEQTPAWKLDRDYTFKAVIAPLNAKLYLDGALLGELPGAFAPAAGSVDAYHSPGFARSAADYCVLESALSLASNSRRSADARWPGLKALPMPMRLYEPQDPKLIAWTTKAGETLTVTAKVRFAAWPDARTLAPFVDRYGQPIHARYPGKVKSDKDLAAAIADEKAHAKGWAPAPDRDRFGGGTKAGWREKPTGFFGVAKRNGFWWLISPEGNPLFYVSLCTADRAAWERTPVTGREFLFAELPPKSEPFSRAWAANPWGWNDNVDYVSFYTANLARKYGDGWYAKTETLLPSRLRQWGFSGVGKWSDSGLPSVPNIAVIYHEGVPELTRHPDVFDASVRETFESVLRRQIEPRKADPWLVGWSVGNEYGEIIPKDEVTEILAKPAAAPAKRALIDHCVDTIYAGDAAAAGKAWQLAAVSRDDLYAAAPKPNDADIETMRRFFADRYYGFIYETVKKIDPNHLYLGFWVLPGWWENEADWSLIGAHCDVLGYDRYAAEFSDANMDRWMAKTGKPVLCGEFSFPPFAGGRRGLGVYAAISTEDDRDAANHYRRWVSAAARNPYCVGVSYFQYRDQPITGRGPGGGANLVSDEHYAFGLVDITDRPKWDLLDTVRAANMAAFGLRRDSTRAADNPDASAAPSIK